MACSVLSGFCILAGSAASSVPVFERSMACRVSAVADLQHRVGGHYFSGVRDRYDSEKVRPLILHFILKFYMIYTYTIT